MIIEYIGNDGIGLAGVNGLQELRIYVLKDENTHEVKYAVLAF